jgi:hypothetical protein
MQMESACGEFSFLVCFCNIQYSEMKWRRRRIKKATEFQYTALPATVNESWKSTSSPLSPSSTPTLVNVPGRDTDPSPPSSAEVQKQSRAIPLLSLRAFAACKKGETYLEHKQMGYLRDPVRFTQKYETPINVECYSWVCVSLNSKWRIDVNRMWLRGELFKCSDGLGLLKKASKFLDCSCVWARDLCRQYPAASTNYSEHCPSWEAELFSLS